MTGTVSWKGGPAAPNWLPDSFPISLFELGVLYDGRVGQYPVRSQQHSDPRFQVHYEKILSNRVYLWSGGPKYFLLKLVLYEFGLRRVKDFDADIWTLAHKISQLVTESGRRVMS